MNGATRECLVCGTAVHAGLRSTDAFLVDRFLTGWKQGRVKPQRLRPTACRRHIMQQTQNKADIEYAVMLAILNFHSEFFRSNYSHVSVQMLEEVIDVVLTRNGAIPGELLLAESEEGRDLLRQVHEAMFNSCRAMLTERIERVMGRKVREIVTSLDPLGGLSRLVIRLEGTSTEGTLADVGEFSGKT